MKTEESSNPFALVVGTVCLHHPPAIRELTEVIPTTVLHNNNNGKKKVHGAPVIFVTRCIYHMAVSHRHELVLEVSKSLYKCTSCPVEISTATSAVKILLYTVRT
jgi:hypothetical protein